MSAAVSLAFAPTLRDDDETRQRELPSGVWLKPGLATTLTSVAARTGEHEAIGVRTVEAPRPASTDDSAALVGRARDGDRSAFRALFDRHRGDVARLVYRMLGPRAEVEDLVQEVFVQVHRSLRDFRGESRFSTWLHRVTVNVVLMHRRAEKSRPQYTAEPVEMSTFEDAVVAHPDEEAERRARIGAFFEVLKEISEKKRVVFVLHDLEGMPPAEIAKVVEVPVLTVRTRLFYARRELEEKMRAHAILAPLVAAGGFAGAVDESGTQRKSRPSDVGSGAGGAQ